MLAWSDDSYGDSEGDTLRVELLSQRLPQVSVILTAEAKANGDVVVSGQDVGPFVESVWGDSDYEYWVTVKARQVANLVAHLRAELDVRVADVQPASTDLLDLSKREGAHLAATLLRTAFHAQKFESSSEYRTWLEEKGVPYQFSSY